MLPRSSSVPVLGSLLPSLSDVQIYSGFGQRSDTKSLGVLRRAQSDGNLDGLTAAVDLDEFLHSPPKPLPTASHDVYQPILRSVPSLAIFNSACGYDEEEVEEKLGGESSERDGCLERSVTFADNVIGVGRAFSFGKNTDLIQEGEGAISIELHSFGAFEEVERPKSPPLYMARGLGIDVGFGGGEDGGYMEFCLPEYGERAHELTDTEEYCARMVEENPGRTLFLRNYAEFLYQSKRDLVGAEEYYARAILSKPGDGEMLSQYAKIVWELDHDHGRASTYFETAIQVAPQNCHVNAAYASFLWETENEEEENSFQEGLGAISNELHSFGTFEEVERPKSSPLYMARGLGIDVGFGGGEDGGFVEFCLPEYGERAHEITDMEEYYARMVEENPGRTLFLRNYAEFLYQSKRDLVGAEEYYARAILSDPGDGELLSQYAKIVWERHHDHERASTYFETAVQVAPENCHVNAAYARFLWETEVEEEENSFQEGLSANSLLQTKAMTSASA